MILASRLGRSILLLSLAAVPLVACSHRGGSSALPADGPLPEPAAQDSSAAEDPLLAPSSPPPAVAPPPEEFPPAPINLGAPGEVAVIKRLPRHNEKSSLGTNLTQVRDYMSEWPFVDVFKKSRDWTSGNAPVNGRPAKGSWVNKEPLDIDEAGWVRSLRPGQMARSLIFWNDDVRIVYPKGDYVVLFEGRGRLEYRNGQIVDQRPGRHVIRVDPAKGGFGVELLETDPNDYIRNIHVIMPGGVCSNDGYRACSNDAGCESGGVCVPFERNFEEQVFHPTFLDRIKTYSTLRFMDWLATNNSIQQDWKDRPKFSDARWSVKGVPLEVIADLANRVSADAWINVPHLATEAYMREMAKLLSKTLDPERRVYVEHSNEVWNNIFEQARFARKRAVIDKLGGNEIQGSMRWHSRRSVTAFKIFEEHFPPARLTRVMGSFIAAPRTSEELIEFEKAYEHTDAVAVAVYFGGGLGNPREMEKARAATLDSIFQEVNGPEFAKIAERVREHVAAAKKRKLDVYAYEGGEHFAGVGEATRDESLNALFDSVGRDPRIKPTYLSLLDLWKKNGGRLFMHFVNCAQPSRHGRFGALEQQEQPRKLAPKFDALQEFIEKNPRWW